MIPIWQMAVGETGRDYRKLVFDDNTLIIVSNYLGEVYLANMTLI